MRSVKEEIRILGIDDGPFLPRTKTKAVVIRVVFRGKDFIDGLIKTEVSVDGLDSTGILGEIIKKSKHKEQTRVIMLNGVTIAGCNNRRV